MPSVADVRASLGDAATGYSDEELLQAVAKTTGDPLPKVYADYGFDTNAGPWEEKANAGWSSYKSNLAGLGGDLAAAAGFNGVADSLNARRRGLAISADVSNSRASAGGIPDRWQDVTGPSSLGKFIGGEALGAGPYLGEALVGGVAGRVLRVATGGLRAAELTRAGASAADVAEAARAGDNAALAGGTVANYPSSVAAIAADQRDQNGQTNLPAAFGLGIPFAALNGAVGVGSIASKTALPGMINPMMDAMTGVKGVAARIAGAGLEEGAVQAGAQAGQAGLGELARASVDPNYVYNDQAQQRIVDAAVGGGALGFAFGAGLSGGRRSAGFDDSPLAAPTGSPPVDPGPRDILGEAAPPPEPPPAPAPPLKLGYDPSVSASPGVHNPDTMFVFPGEDGRVAANPDELVHNANMPQPGGDSALYAAFHAINKPEIMDAVTDPAAPPAPRDVLGTEYALQETPAPTDNLPSEQNPIQTSAPTQATDPRLGATPGPAMPQLNPPKPDEAGSGVPPEVPVTGSGTPEALARLQQTQQRVSDAKDAIVRAREAGMNSDKQQSGFWRAEELVEQGKLSESKMTQATALLLQSKFGVVEKMLNDAAAGIPDKGKQAVVKETMRTLDQVDKEMSKLAEERTPLFDAAGRRPKTGTPKRDQWDQLTAQIQSLRDERQKIVDHGADKLGLEQAPEVTPHPMDMQDAASTPTQAPAPTGAESTPAQRLKASADRANKIRRFQSLLACITR